MKTTSLNILAVAAVTAAVLSTAAFAERGGPRGPGGHDGLFPGMMPSGENLFEQMDANADGQVTQEEVAAYRAGLVTGLDSNGDGLISAAEVEAAYMARAAERAKAAAERMMAARDANGDGQLSAAEMALPPMPARMFERLDANDDSVISAEEAEAARERFADRKRPGHGREDRRAD